MLSPREKDGDEGGWHCARVSLRATSTLLVPLRSVLAQSCPPRNGHLLHHSPFIGPRPFGLVASPHNEILPRIWRNWITSLTALGHTQLDNHNEKPATPLISPKVAIRDCGNPAITCCSHNCQSVSTSQTCLQFFLDTRHTFFVRQPLTFTFWQRLSPIQQNAFHLKN